MPKGGKSGNGDISGNKRDNVLTGTDANDVINGRGGNDLLSGLDGADTLFGGTGNDTLQGGLGDDQINGGSGNDTAVYAGNRDEYTVTDLSGGLIEITGPDGTDTITDVETFQFADMTQSAAEVIQPRLANLTATLLGISDTSLDPGEGATASFQLGSNGAVDAGATSFELLIAASPDEATVISVLDTQSAAAISTGETEHYTATIPANAVPPGTYWVAVRVDADAALVEENEADNLTEWIQITIAEPITDLRLAAATIDQNSDTDLGLGGGEIVIDYTLQNVGNAGSGDYVMRAFLSRDGTVSADDIEIATNSGQLFAGNAATGQLVGSLAEDTPEGDWQVLTALEWAGGEADATPADNMIANAVTLTPAVADLVLNAATLGPNTDLDLTGGGRLEMTYDWQNAGTTTPSYFTIRSYLSTDATISADDKPVLGITGGTVTGQTSSVTTSHWFQEDFAAGEYYLISAISWGDGSADATPENNTLIQLVNFTSAPTDLAITNVTLDPGSDLLIDADGGYLSFSVDVANLGGLDSSAPLRAYLSTDNNISTDDIVITADTGTIAAGGSTTVAAGVALNTGVAAGDYRLIVTLAAPDDDASNSIFYADVTLEEPAPDPVIFGTEDADILTGTAGDDVIEALGGDDVVFATAGFDQVDGGTGFDRIDFSQRTERIELTTDTYSAPGELLLQDPTTSGTQQSYTGFEAITGTAFDDFVMLYGSEVTSLDLGDGNDIAVASDFDDIIDAGAGDDLIQGGLGDDNVTLGEGADLFGVVRFSEGPFPSGHGNDVITDFDVTMDILYFQIENGTMYDPHLDTTQTAEGALISYINGSSILLEDVNMDDLSAANFMFEDTIYTGLA